MNNNYWQKKCLKFLEEKKKGSNKNFDQFSKTEYKADLEQALEDLTLGKSKQAYKTFKRLTNYAQNAKILDIKKGPLLGKFNQELKGKTLTDESEILREI